MNVVRSFVCAACIAVSASLSVAAQVKDGIIAPDFTVMDLNGTTHHLYEYLEQGKFVVLDFMSAYCEPCWEYHESGQLEEFYMKHGPGGTNKAVVLMIDSWIATNEENLNGTEQPTYGDWLSGTPYPVIDLTEASPVVKAYDASTVPRVYRICPATKRVYNVLPITSEGVAEEATAEGLELSMTEQCGVAAIASEYDAREVVVTAADGRIYVSVPDAGACTIMVYTVAGDVVSHQQFAPGTSTKVMEAAGLSSGVYLVRVITSRGRAVARTITIVR